MSRPEKPINWELVDKLLMAGSLGTEIAAHFDIHPNTFYDRVQAKYNCGFTEYSQEKRARGDSMIRAKQFEKAMEGNNIMLIWLGKNRLGQREGEEKNPLPPNDTNLTDLITAMKALKEKENATESKTDTEL